MSGNVTLTDAMQRAMKWLREHGGEGAIDKRGSIIAAGERSAFDSVTWLRLMSLGELEPAGPLRLRIPPARDAAMKEGE